MERGEKLQFQKEIEEYFDKHRVYDLFEKLFKELIIYKPDSPIDYLIDRIKKKDTKRIFITGLPGTERKSIALSVAENLGFMSLSVDDHLDREKTKKLENARAIEKNYYSSMQVDDDIVIDLVKKQLIKYEESNVSYIVEGFPKNRVI